MGTQRYISTSFWDDAWIQTLDPSEKLLYLYLMTNPLTNIAGVYKITTRRICFDTGFNSDTVGHIFTKFEKSRKAFRINEYVALPSWPKHQKWEKSDKIKIGIDLCLFELDGKTLESLSKTGYHYNLKKFFDTLSIPYTYGSNYSEFDLDSDIDINSDINNSPAPQNNDTQKKSSSFKKPDISEVKDYFSEKGCSQHTDRFYDFYESKGWMVGKNKMKDWKAACRNWIRQSKEYHPEPEPEKKREVIIEL